jgi:hypothetical protein
MEKLYQVKRFRSSNSLKMFQSTYQQLDLMRDLHLTIKSLNFILFCFILWSFKFKSCPLSRISLSLLISLQNSSLDFGFSTRSLLSSAPRLKFSDLLIKLMMFNNQEKPFKPSSHNSTSVRNYSRPLRLSYFYLESNDLSNEPIKKIWLENFIWYLLN